MTSPVRRRADVSLRVLVVLTVAIAVSFSAPGTYVLRAIASDGQLASIHNITVTVNSK